uniref:Uncharacterized protein n=1 Tax=Caenorhabditis tropicalis TaxID=1561998 RepID=A0A1I7UNA1_9PELO
MVVHKKAKKKGGGSEGGGGEMADGDSKTKQKCGGGKIKWSLKKNGFTVNVCVSNLSLLLQKTLETKGTEEDDDDDEGEEGHLFYL